MKESELTHRFMTELKKQIPAIWYSKIHGDPMQKRGIPDFLMCINGKFVAIEFKIFRYKLNVSPLQQHEMEKIGRAGGIALVIFRRERDGKICFLDREYDSVKEAVDGFVWGIVRSIEKGIL